MMKENKKLIITAAVTLVSLVLLITFMVVDLDLGIIKIASISTIMNSSNEINYLDEQLTQKKADYESKVSSLDTSKEEYEKQKLKYDAISDETIQIIKEATTNEKYNIDYMWIRLGNYATRNNLDLVLVEPGGTAAKEDEESKDNNNQVTSSAVETTPEKPDTPTEPSPTTPVQSTGGELSIKVKGTYTNVSDFIFEVENDKELRFKLDKIKMEYSGSNLITATFAVKNLVFMK